VYTHEDFFFFFFFFFMKENKIAIMTHSIGHEILETSVSKKINAVVDQNQA
jgi:hypothetical protein